MQVQGQEILRGRSLEGVYYRCNRRRMHARRTMSISSAYIWAAGQYSKHSFRILYSINPLEATLWVGFVVVVVAFWWDPTRRRRVYLNGFEAALEDEEERAIAMEQAQADKLTATAAKLTPATGMIKFLKDCTAGTVGGIAVVGVGHPFGAWFCCWTLS